MRFRTILIAILVTVQADVPASASLAKPVGVITQVEDGWLDRTAATTGATVYAGDSLETGASGTLRLRVGRSQLYLLASSTAVLADSPGGVRATLARGTAGVASSGAASLELGTPLAVIRPKGSLPSHGQVTVLNPGEFLVSSYHGTLEVDVDGEIHAVSEGQAYRVIMEPEPQDSNSGGWSGSRAGTIRIRSSRRKVIFVAAAIGVGTLLGAWIYHELTESPSKMDDR